MLYRYETHAHTSPVSRCARATVEETVRFYKELGYDGLFITNHFLDGNINIAPETPYREKIEFYFKDYEDAFEVGKRIGLKVFPGVELTYGGTDFLIYGLDKEWYLGHPEIMEMKKSEELPFMISEGALVVQAHPFREADYIDHIRLYPQCVHGVEVYNAGRNELSNRLAMFYAEAYGFLKTAGTDNHTAANVKKLGGMRTETPVESVADFIRMVKAGETVCFTAERSPETGEFLYTDI